MAAAVVMGCSKNATSNPSDTSTPEDSGSDNSGSTTLDSYVPSDYPIAFYPEGYASEESSSAPATKATLVSDDNMSDFGILAYYVAGENGVAATTLPADATANFMNNQLIERENNNWIYTPVKYWPNTSTDRIQFFAYFPYSGSAGTLGVTTETTKGERPKITYEPLTDASTQYDFMTAATGLLSKEGGAIELCFEHQLTQVVFSTRSNSSIPAYVTGIVIKGVKYFQGQFQSDNSFEWLNSSSDLGTTKEFSLSYDNGGLVKSTGSTTDPAILNYNEADPSDTSEVEYTTVSTTLGTLLLPPQDLAAGQVTISVVFMAYVEKNWVTASQDIIVNSPHTYIKGQKVNYQFTTDVADVGVEDVEITLTGWTAGGDITPGDNVIL